MDSTSAKLEANLKNLSLEPSKKENIIKNKKLTANFNKIIEIEPFPESFLFYELATTMPKDISQENLKKIVNLIKENIISTKKELQQSYILLKNNKEVKFRYKTKEDLINYLKETKLSEIDAKSKILKECEYNLQPNEILDTIRAHTSKSDNIKKSILEIGELKKLHTPTTNYQKTDKILQEHLKRTGGKYITRFPPEPNGCLHIGHAKSLYLNFNYAKIHNGECIIRFDDTNPKNEKQEYYDSILESVNWMGYTSKRITAASDQFDKLIELGFELIRRDKAFVCHQTADEMKIFREQHKMSPYRNRPLDESEKLFRDMVDGKIKPGDATLRLKQPFNKDNPLTFDLVAFRIIDENIKHSKNSKHVYPTYDYTHCLNDSLEDITHSFCSKEFMIRRETYYWLIDALDLYRPVQWEFSRLNISQTVLSKRKLTKLVDEKVVDGWDDPRLYTLIGLRRRGVRPVAINNFVESVGYTFNETVIDVKKFEKCIREDLFKISKKVSVIKEPVKLNIKNYKNKEDVKITCNITNETDTISFSNSIFIDKEDFILCENCIINDSECICKIPTDFVRFTKNNHINLLYIQKTVKFLYYKDNTIFVEEVEFNNSNKYINWVDTNNYDTIQVYKYSHLFKSFEPELKGNMFDDIHENSLTIYKNSVVDKGYNILNNKDKRYQFIRFGYFIYDEKNKGFNMTISLKAK